MTTTQIQKLRQTLGETTAEFGARWGYEPRPSNPITCGTVEKWEQGTAAPNRFVLPRIERLARAKGVIK